MTDILDGVVLVLDASASSGAVAVLRDGRLLAEGTTPMRGEREERLMPLVASALSDAGVGVASIRRIVCGEGPGSFTSLRIAASIAKGIASAHDLPVHAVSSLALLVASSGETHAPGEYLAVMDALRAERYVARCTVGEAGAVLAVSALELVGAASLASLRAGTPVIDGTRDGDARGNRAAGVVRLGPMLATRPAVDLATWEPVYGRLAEAQVRWEAAHGRSLSLG